jgi:hypothetical protein
VPLISCPDCGKQVSDRAPACIGCGRPIAQTGGLAPALASLGRAETAQAVKEGQQRAEGRRSVGNLMTFAAIVIGIAVMFASPVLGLLVILGGMGAAAWVKYGW